MMLLQGDSLTMLRTLDAESVDCCATSPPYFNLRDYGIEGQIGLEPTIDEYLERLLAVFDEVNRVLKKSGCAFINLGDSYAGVGGKNPSRPEKGACVIKEVAEKSLCLIPYRFAQAMMERFWVLRNIIVWHKPNAMPHSVKDRFTVDFEPVFFFVKSQRYWFKQQFEPHKEASLERYEYGLNARSPEDGFCAAGSKTGIFSSKRMGDFIQSEGRNKRTVWSIPTQGLEAAHFAVFPEELVRTILDCGCPPGGTVLDPFMGAGTVALVAEKMSRKWIGIELNPDYCKMIEDRVRMEAAQFKFDFAEENP